MFYLFINKLKEDFKYCESYKYSYVGIIGTKGIKHFSVTIVVMSGNFLFHRLTPFKIT